MTFSEPRTVLSAFGIYLFNAHDTAPRPLRREVSVLIIFSPFLEEEIEAQRVICPGSHGRCLPSPHSSPLSDVPLCPWGQLTDSCSLGKAETENRRM